MTRHGIRKHLPNRSLKAGLPPGSLVYIGRAKKALSAQPRITVMTFENGTVSERTVESVAELMPLKPAPAIAWINVDAVHDAKLLAEFGEAFHLNPLLLEDILNTEQRPKAEHVDGLTYIILKLFEFQTPQEEIFSEQVSIVTGPHFILSFMDEVSDEFEPLRNRLRTNSQRLSSLGPGYLAYSLLDTIVDSYFSVLEEIGARLEYLEDTLSGEQPPNILQSVHRLRRELIFLRKNIWPVRDMINLLQHLDSETLLPLQPYLRDVYDHTIQVMDTLESYRDLLSGLQDLYLSVLSYRMNDVMKVLTVMSTIFIPLTFIAGVYGMNFKYMPELQSHWGYPLVWGVMILSALGMLAYFRHKRWI
ncbi:magnesium/cobalt transporter CorA [Vampirovibrio chlorellavorus]|uniref:magnesium/cobalt transporter CorA n=1 Tax=Vampirovibrio chlorellavorus TaxID=758823 RepID=UPI0026EAF87D|nr:magnesium/cobalt transporter CorA [Vampirovibrio chlorellavorus]